MSGVAASFDQATGILKLLCETKWTKDEIQRRFFAHWGVLRDIAVALGDGKLTEEQVRAMHSLFCNKKATFQSLLAACRQDWVHPDFEEKNFPLETVADDEDEWEVHEHHFQSAICGKIAFEEFKAMGPLGFRLCGVRRAIEFIAAHPDLQLDHPLIVTTLGLNRGSHRCAPVFDRGDGKRKVYLNSLTGDFGPRCGWLVLHKRPA